MTEELHVPYCTVLYCTVLYVPMALCIAEPKRLFSSCVVRTSSAHTSGQGPGFNTPQWEVTSPVRHVWNKGSRVRFLRSYDIDLADISLLYWKFSYRCLNLVIVYKEVVISAKRTAPLIYIMVQRF